MFPALPQIYIFFSNWFYTDMVLVRLNMWPPFMEFCFLVQLISDPFKVMITLLNECLPNSGILTSNIPNLDVCQLLAVF